MESVHEPLMAKGGIEMRMKLLVLDTNIRYANPTARLFLTALAERAHVVMGGLGYGVDTSDLRALERTHGRFDAIVGQIWMFGQSGVGRYGAVVPRDLRDHAAPKVLNHLQIDPHAFPEYQYMASVVAADLVRAAVEAVVNGTYGGTRWRDGCQVLIACAHSRASVH
jgi:hypothetical protein